MKIAIPQANDQLAQHFGHCENFALIDVDQDEKKILKKELVTPPPHEPGVLPRWLGEQGAEMIIAGGMGQRAQQLFQAQNIKVIVGVAPGAVEDIVMAYLNQELITGVNFCDH